MVADRGRSEDVSNVLWVEGLPKPTPKVVLRPIRPASPVPPLSSSPKEVIPASSRIRNSLNLSRKLFLPGRPFISNSLPSSNLLSIISGLLPTVVTEDIVFLRSPFPGEVSDGDMTGSFGAELFRDNQENGIVNFLVGAGAGGDKLTFGGAWGGGDHGIDGRTPDRPCSPVLTDLCGSGGFSPVQREVSCKPYRNTQAIFRDYCTFRKFRVHGTLVFIQIDIVKRGGREAMRG